MNNEELEVLKQKYTVSDDKIKEITNLIFKRITHGKHSQENPIMIIAGGQPGAGKTGLIDKTFAELENSVVLDVDDFRYFHPDIKEILKKYPNDLATFTIKFVNAIFKNILEMLIAGKYNMIAQKTLRDDEIIYDTLEPLAKAGYTNIVRVLAVSELESKLSTLERSLSVKRTVGYCRWTPINNQNYAYNGLPTTTKHIFESDYCDVVQVFKRNDIPTNATIIYSKAKESSKEKIAASLKGNEMLFLDDFGTENFTDAVDAITKTRERDALLNIGNIMTRLVLAKRVMDDEGVQYLEQLEELASNYYLKLNDIADEWTIDNNMKLELAKEIMARVIAFKYHEGVSEDDEGLKLLLWEEREMNRFNTVVIDKIINVYGKQIKNGENK